MTASQSQAKEVKLSQHAVHQAITGLGSNVIPTYSAVKTLPIQEPAEAQKDEEGEGRDFCFLSLEISVNHWTSQCRATRDSSGS